MDDRSDRVTREQALRVPKNPNPAPLPKDPPLATAFAAIVAAAIMTAIGAAAIGVAIIAVRWMLRIL